MDEQKVIDQIKGQMASQGVTLAELGRRVSPESANPRQTVHQYMAGRRSLFTGTGRAILDALGLEIVIQPKQNS